MSRWTDSSFNQGRDDPRPVSYNWGMIIAIAGCAVFWTLVLLLGVWLWRNWPALWN